MTSKACRLHHCDLLQHAHAFLATHIDAQVDQHMPKQELCPDPFFGEVLAGMHLQGPPQRLLRFSERLLHGRPLLLPSETMIGRTNISPDGSP